MLVVAAVFSLGGIFGGFFEVEFEAVDAADGVEAVPGFVEGEP